MRTSRNECLTKSRVTKRKTEVTSWTILSRMTERVHFWQKSMNETVILRQNHVNYKSPLRPWPLTFSRIFIKAQNKLILSPIQYYFEWISPGYFWRYERCLMHWIYNFICIWTFYTWYLKILKIIVLLDNVVKRTYSRQIKKSDLEENMTSSCLRCRLKNC